MILPKQPQSTLAVAGHYDELDDFYREVWGEHVHHGYWATGRESAAEATQALVELLAERLEPARGGMCATSVAAMERQLNTSPNATA